MIFLLNVIIAIVAGLVADWILGRCRIVDPLKIILAVLVALVFFFLNLASQIVNSS